MRNHLHKTIRQANCIRQEYAGKGLINNERKGKPRMAKSERRTLPGRSVTRDIGRLGGGHALPIVGWFFSEPCAYPACRTLNYPLPQSAF